MHIKELVLDGFKSFGRETRLPFYEDFTVITGPNGSGKSNIIDAVLFALGLARTRGIRAEKLTDLIYNPGHDGDSAGGAGPSEASVTVVLDNSDGTLERSQVVSAAGTEDVGDHEEITVRRRVKETEENYYSYYYLNGRSVNLSDIRDLLASAGIAPEGYNVVMQGDVTEIINMTPRERREIIDEIAGVAEFDAKKEDAFEELETVEERVSEADLRIEEKEARLDQLADERETALEYRELREEKQEQEGYLAAAELEAKREERAAVDAEIEALEADLEGRRGTLEERQGKVDRLEADLEGLNREIERKGEDEQLRIKGEIEELKGEISRLEGEIEAAEKRIEAAESDRREAFVAIDRKEETVEDLEAELREIKVEKASVTSEISDKEDDLAAVEAEIESVDTEFDELKAELAELKERREELKGEAAALQREKDRLLDEARRRSTRIEETEAELAAARERVPEVETDIGDLRRELEKAEANLEKIEGVIEDLAGRKADRADRLGELKEALSAKQSEYAELEAKADRDGGDSWPRSVTTVLNAGFDGVHGAVGQLGSVTPEYATACETAAGGRLANAVVDDDGVGADCIDHLKARNAGRATFLPLTELDDRGLPSLPSHPGVVDFAYDLVEFDDRYAGVFSYVLGATLVVEEMDVARDLMGEYRMVTLEGDLVEKSGAMTGGSGGGTRFSFSKSGDGRLERLAAEINDLEAERAEFNEAIRELEGDLEDARDRRSAAAEKVRSIETEIERREADREDLEAEIEELEATLEDLRSEREATEAEMSELESEIEAVEAELAESRVPELTDRADEIRGEIDDLEDRLDDLDARLNEKRLEKEYAEEAIEDLTGQVESAQNRKAEAEERIEDLEGEIDDREASLAEKRAAVADLEEELAELKADREDLRAALRSAAEERDEAREAVAAVESDLAEARERADRLDAEIRELEAEVGEYDPEDVPDHDAVEAAIRELEAEMDALEPVNMLAIDEYDDVEAELADLQERRDVLVEERDGIEERIERYEAQKREAFMEAYEAIDDHFRDVFARLSAGTGELHLEDPEDPFEGGLTMKARPGDKPVQRLDAMSGGEKSLTALAFIFAIQRHNPAPFYALDEIDAFLDAANAERVGEMVDDLAGEAQFVVVSHRSALLERSERAIGVTMQEDNFSAVTGIQLGADTGGEVSADD